MRISDWSSDVCSSDLRQNLDAIRARGLEIDASFSHGPWSFAASYAYADSRVRASGAALALDGLRPAQTPRHQGSATIGWRGEGGLTASVTGRYVSRQFEDDVNVRRLDDALTFDAAQIGRASFRERACPYVTILWVAVSFKQKTKTRQYPNRHN